MRMNGAVLAAQLGGGATNETGPPLTPNRTPPGRAPPAKPTPPATEKPLAIPIFTGRVAESDAPAPIRGRFA